MRKVHPRFCSQDFYKQKIMIPMDQHCSNDSINPSMLAKYQWLLTAPSKAGPSASLLIECYLILVLNGRIVVEIFSSSFIFQKEPGRGEETSPSPFYFLSIYLANHNFLYTLLYRIPMFICNYHIFCFGTPSSNLSIYEFFASLSKYYFLYFNFYINFNTLVWKILFSIFFLSQFFMLCYLIRCLTLLKSNDGSWRNQFFFYEFSLHYVCALKYDL